MGVICDLVCVVQLKSENARLLKALVCEKNSVPSLQKLQQQVVSLSSHWARRQTHQISGGEGFGYYFTNCKQWMKVSHTNMHLSENVTLIGEVPLEAPNRIAKIMFTESPNSPTSPSPHHLLCLDSQLHAKKFIESHPVKRKHQCLHSFENL